MNKQHNIYIYVKIKQHLSCKSDHTKFYYILNVIKLFSDKWVKPSGLMDSEEDG